MGEASYRLLRSLGPDVDYPLEQTCCGQPMATVVTNATRNRWLAERMEELFAGTTRVVGPPVSCVSFVREGYPPPGAARRRQVVSGVAHEIHESFK